MRYHLRLVASLLIVLVSALGLGIPQQTDDLAAAKGPQKFALDPGERTSFAVPVTQPGTFIAELKWSGSPMNLAVLDPTGKAVRGPETKTSLARYEVTVTADDVSHGLVWRVSLTAPKSATDKPAAKGMIQLHLQPFDSAKLSPEIQRKAQAHRELKAHLSITRTMTGEGSPADEREKARTKRNAQSESALNAKFGEAASNLKAQRVAQVQNLAFAIRGKRAPDFKLDSPALSTNLANVQRITAPLVTSVTPSQGFTGDKVVIDMINVKQGTGPYFVSFVVENNSGQGKSASILGTVESGSANGSNLTLTVTLPQLPKDFPHVDHCYVEVDGYGNPPAFAAIGPDFTWTNVPVASVSDCGVNGGAAAAVPGDYLDIKGTNLDRKSTSIHFIVPGNQDAPASDVVFVDSTHIRAKVPPYLIDHQTTGIFWAQTTTPTGAKVNDVWHPFIILPTVPMIMKIDRATGIADETVMVQGTGFASNAQVVFKTPGGQEHVAYPTSSNDGTLLVKIPDIKLVPMEGYDGTIQVRNTASNLSNAFGFHINPILDLVPVLDRNLIACLHCDSQDDDPAWRYLDPAAYQDSSMAAQAAATAKKDGFIAVSHYSGAWNGHKDTDQFQLKTPLYKNGWRFSKVTLHKSIDPSDMGDAFVEKVVNDAAGPIAFVHWWCDAQWYWQSDNTSVYYNLQFWIEGPRGYPYK